MIDAMDREDAVRYAEWFATLGDPTRVQLLAWLAQRIEPVAVRDIVAVFPHSQSTISHHLAALARTCFVTCERVGTSSYYAVNPACLQVLPAAAESIMNGLAPIHCLPGRAVDLDTTLDTSASKETDRDTAHRAS